MEVRLADGSAADVEAIRRVVRAAFATPAEAVVVEQLYRDGDVALSAVVEHASSGSTDGAPCTNSATPAAAGVRVVGAAVLTELVVRPSRLRMLALAPVAVAPAHQRHGVGTAAVQCALDAARAATPRVHAVVVLGAPAYYSRFGFSSRLGQRVASAYTALGDAFMAIELVDGALTSHGGGGGGGGGVGHAAVSIEYAEAFQRM